MQPSVHPVDEQLPIGRLGALGLQHVLVVCAGAVAVPLNVFFNGASGDTSAATNAARQADAH